MVEIQIKLKNEKAILKKIEKYPEKMAIELQKAIAKVGIYTAGQVKSVITSGDGMWKSPVDSGQMRQGISSSIGRLKATIKSSNRTPYAFFVHEGTRKMRARPFMSITAKRKKRDIERFFNKAIENAIK